jgi:hypothetical protein
MRGTGEDGNGRCITASEKQEAEEAREFFSSLFLIPFLFFRFLLKQIINYEL